MRRVGGWRMLIRLFSALVPWIRRADWRAEWEAELAWAESEMPGSGRRRLCDEMHLRMRAMSSLVDAAWLRYRHGRVTMVGQDVRQAVRSLARRPAFAIVAVLTMVLGIGGVSAIFSVVDAMLWRPLPYAEVERLAQVWPVRGAAASPAMSEADYEIWRQQTGVFDRVEAHTGRDVVVSGAGFAERADVELVTPGLIRLLGVPALLGRTFIESDAEPGSVPVVILGASWWRSRFGSDGAVIGRPIEIDGIEHQVIGVMPDEFRYPFGVNDMYMPVDARSLARMTVLARIAPGLTVEAAAERLAGISAALETDQPRGVGWQVRLHPVSERAFASQAKPAMLFMSAAVLVVLLTGCVNTANLMLVRATARGRELAVRGALGATRLRLLRLQLVESLVLAVIAGGLGIAVAWLGVRGLLVIAPASFITYSPGAFRIDGRVLAVACALSLSTGILFGLVPAVVASRNGRSLIAPERMSTDTRLVKRVRAGLAIAEMALAMTLLVSSGLLIRSVRSTLHRDAGFVAEGLLTVSLTAPEYRYREPAARIAFYNAVYDHLAAIPGVEVALADGAPPTTGFAFGVRLEAEGRESSDDGQPFLLPNAAVGPSYFDVLGIPIETGRSFGPQDVTGAEPVAIVDHDLARFLWPGANPIGRRFRIGDSQPWLTVVGVAGNVDMLGYMDLQMADCASACHFGYYRPLGQTADRRGQHTFLLRTRGDAAASGPAVREAIRQVDAAAPITGIATMPQRLRDRLDKERFVLRLVSLFTLVAVLLAGTGVYGVLAWGVARRTREIGVRVALGAGSKEVVADLLRRGFAYAAAGAGLGVLGALAAHRLIRGMLYDIGPSDPIALVAATTLITIVAIAASLGPARRAVRVSPLEAMRVD